MRKKLIDSSKSDLKKYMMIVESAGKVPASTEEDFTLEDIENPYFQGDEDTEESEGNRYYLTVGVKIGFDENVESYFPELIWDTETGTEIEFDKLDKISKKAIQDKCDEVGSKMTGGKRNNVSESTQLKKGDKVKIKPFEKSLGQYGYNHGKPATVVKTRLGSYTSLVKLDDGNEIEVDTHDLVLTENKTVSESTQVIVKALMQKFQISESRAKQIVAKVSESLKQK